MMPEVREFESGDERMQTADREWRPVDRLTPREVEVLKLIAEGHSTKQVAGMLGISFKTAACHRSRLLAKAGVHESVSLLRWAIRRGFVTP